MWLPEESFEMYLILGLWLVPIKFLHQQDDAQEKGEEVRGNNDTSNCHMGWVSNREEPKENVSHVLTYFPLSLECSFQG